MIDNWVMRKKPARLERRIEFSNYEETRDFLERAAELSEATGYYPDMSFGRTHVSITLQPQVDADEVGDELMQFAMKLDAMVPTPKISTN